MVKVLIVKVNSLFYEKTPEEIRADILRQINEGGVVVLDNGIKHDVVEFDVVQVADSSPQVTQTVESILFEFVCSGCSGCCNCFENGNQYECERYKEYYDWLVNKGVPLGGVSDDKTGSA